MARMTVDRGSPVWLAVALVAVGGFFAWLFISTRSLETAVQPRLEEEAGAAYETLAPQALAAGMRRAVGRTVNLQGAPVAASLGRGVFSLQLDSATRYPVLMDADLIALETRVYGGDRVDLWGHIFTLNDSIRGAWVEQRAVDAGSADQVPRTPSFLLADSLEVVP